MANRQKWSVKVKDAWVEYHAWQSMRSRCKTEDYRDFPRYGGRKITVCKAWGNNFDKFLEDMGRSPGKGYSLDRKNNNKGYSKANCKWSTSLEQNNNRASTKTILVNGVSMSYANAERVLGLPKGRIKGRILKGFSNKAALLKPLLVLRGTSHPAAKLTLADVQRIRKLYASPNRKKGDVTKLAQELGVHPKTILYTGQGTTWRHVK